MYINLQLAKQHLNLDASFIDDDEYITQLIDVSEVVVEKYANTSLTDIATANSDVLPTPLMQAMLLFVGNLYANREVATFANVNKLPFNFEFLIDFYKNYSN